MRKLVYAILISGIATALLVIFDKKDESKELIHPIVDDKIEGEVVVKSTLQKETSAQQEYFFSLDRIGRIEAIKSNPDAVSELLISRFESLKENTDKIEYIRMDTRYLGVAASYSDKAYQYLLKAINPTYWKDIPSERDYDHWYLAGDFIISLGFVNRISAHGRLINAKRMIEDLGYYFMSTHLYEGMVYNYYQTQLSIGGIPDYDLFIENVVGNESYNNYSTISKYWQENSEEARETRRWMDKMIKLYSEQQIEMPPKF